LVVNYFDDTVSMINTATSEVVATINVGGYPRAIAGGPRARAPRLPVGFPACRYLITLMA
jgi:YVTN family beta-propeller protein